MIAGGLGLVALTGIVILVNYLARPSYLDILVAPIDAEVTIDGAKYRNATYEMAPGKYEAEITKDGYEAKKIIVEVERGRTAGLYAYLDPADGDFSAYELKQNSESLTALLKLNGFDAMGQESGKGSIIIDGDQTVDKFINKVTIGAKMPIYTSVCGTPARRTNCNAVSVNYDYDARCGGKLCLIIEGRESSLSGEALKTIQAEIEVMGRSFEEYQYVYNQNIRM